MNRTGVNSPNPHVASILKTLYVVELGLQLVCRAEKVLLAPDDEHTGGQDCQRRHNKSAQPRGPRHRSLLRMLQKFSDKFVIARFKVVKAALNYDVSVIEQSQTVCNCFGAVHIMSHHDGRHVMLLL